MKHEDTVKLIGLIVVAYPNFDRFKDEAHIRATVALWDMMFADDEKWLVTMAVEKHISTNKWPPSIAEIREIMADIKTPSLLMADEAWGMVKKLMDLHESLYMPASHYLPEPIAEAVEAVGYDYLINMGRAATQGKGKEGLDRLAFIQSYEPRLRKAREKASLPEKLQDKLSRAHQHFMDGTEDKLRKLEADHAERYDSMSLIPGLSQLLLNAPKEE